MQKFAVQISIVWVPERKKSAVTMGNQFTKNDWEIVCKLWFVFTQLCQNVYDQG